MGNKEVSFYLPQKDFAKILRHERRYYLLASILILLLLIADGVLLALSIRDGINLFYIVPIPVLSILYGIIWFLGITNGGVQIFKQCKLVISEDKTLILSCTRESTFALHCETQFSKTMKVSKLTEKDGYWIVYDKKRQWAVVPKSIPLKEMLDVD